MKPQTENQRIVLETVRRLQAHYGRSILLREIATELGRPMTSIHPAAQELVEAGLLSRGADGRGKGLQIADIDKHYREGWEDAVEQLEASILTLLLQHHASPSLKLAAEDAFKDARQAIGVAS
jgi:DNA-binding MarR family transcriptional regulator